MAPGLEELRSRFSKVGKAEREKKAEEERIALREREVKMVDLTLKGLVDARSELRLQNEEAVRRGGEGVDVPDCLGFCEARNREKAKRDTCRACGVRGNCESTDRDLGVWKNLKAYAPRCFIQGLNRKDRKNRIQCNACPYKTPCVGHREYRALLKKREFFQKKQKEKEERDRKEEEALARAAKAPDEIKTDVVFERYEYRGLTAKGRRSEKFWEVARRGRFLLRRWGKIRGTKVDRLLNVYSSDTVAQERMDELTSQKTGKGYRYDSRPTRSVVIRPDSKTWVEA